VFVSVHLNSFRSPTTLGIETYYLGPSDDDELDAIAERENQHSGYSMADLRTLLDKIFTDARRDESRRLAAAVQDTLVAQMRRVGATAVDRGVKAAPFVVLVATDMPAILAEVSCLSNTHEAERLNSQDYRQQIAAALAAGVDNFARARG
jgi:N-acetylmuramoyl-L-alanine amidase